MARLTGVFPIEGSIGNLSFVRSGSGTVVRAKSGMAAERIRKDPRFQGTRDMNNEFGRAGAAAKRLRSALYPTLPITGDPTMYPRLTRRMLQVLRSDTTGRRGERSLSSGQLRLMEGFEFNDRGALSRCFHTPYELAFERATGELSLEMDALIPGCAIDAPEGTRYFRLVLAGTYFDPAGQQSVAVAHSDLIPFDHQLRPATSLQAGLTAGSALPVVACVGLSFYEALGSELYPLDKGKWNALGLVRVF